MNSLNSSSVDVGAGTAITRAQRQGEAGTDVSGLGKASVSILATSVALGLTDRFVVVFGSEGAELLK